MWAVNILQLSELHVRWNRNSLAYMHYCQVDRGMYQDLQQMLQVSRVLCPKPIHLQDLHDMYLLVHPVQPQVVSNKLLCFLFTASFK